MINEFFITNLTEDLWLPRSLFVVGVHLLVCVEDLVKFSSLLVDASSSPYFSLDSCCAISDISEIVSPVISLTFFFSPLPLYHVYIKIKGELGK